MDVTTNPLQVHQRSGVDKSCAPAPRRWGVSLAGFAAVVEAAGGRAALEGAGDEWLKERGLLAAVAAAGGLTALIGKPEKWATEHGLDPARDDADEDPDDDGYTNLDEYLLDTDPVTPAPGTGCGCGGGARAAVLAPLLALLRRRRTNPARTRPARSAGT